MSQNSLILPTTGTVSGLTMTQDTNAALDTLNTLSSGASAPSSPEAGQFWHDTTANILKLRSLDNTTWISLFSLNETAYTSTAFNIPPLVPPGRLTVQSSTPVQTADNSAATAVYYTPYVGAVIPIYNGTFFQGFSFTQLTLTLNTSNHLSGKVYDVFIFNNSGTVTIGTGPAWTNTTSRSAAITQTQGLWVNNASINLINNATTYSGIAASQATYVGSIYASANGQTSMLLKPGQTAGGNNNLLGVYNAYNRVKMVASCQDSSSAWTYTSGTIRPANNSTSNRITFLDGLQQSPIISRYSCGINTTTASNGGQIGVGVNSTTAYANNSAVADASLATNSTAYVTGSADQYPIFGLSYVQALENCPFFSSGSMLFNNGTSMYLVLEIDL